MACKSGNQKVSLSDRPFVRKPVSQKTRRAVFKIGRQANLEIRRSVHKKIRGQVSQKASESDVLSVKRSVCQKFRKLDSWKLVWIELILLHPN